MSVETYAKGCAILKKTLWEDGFGFELNASHWNSLWHRIPFKSILAKHQELTWS